MKGGENNMGKLKDRTQFATSIKIELKEQFQELSERTRIPQSKLMDEAIENLLKKHGFIESKDKPEIPGISYRKLMEKQIQQE